ncbi:MAG: glycosyltransferase family 4 protein [Bacteroidales bacterium]|jgi:glycosyltransferase involved in cell wall biosynthesis|nr:glycosyltransferase family 4 protein [Bacteroidales bacterium]
MKDNKLQHVCHLTSVHTRFDSRIYYKECVSLARNEYQVSLVVADGKGDEHTEIKGEKTTYISIIDVGNIVSRWKRLLFMPRKIYKTALKLKANIYHFHDPELFFVGLRLKRKGFIVIFDSHEDFPALMKQRDYIPKIFKRCLFFFATQTEKYISRRLSGVISATDEIRRKFIAYGLPHTQTIKNYSVINNIEFKSKKFEYESPVACYVGGLTQIRGIEEIVLACEKADVPLLLAGGFDREAFYEKLKQTSAWQNVIFFGKIPHSQTGEAVYMHATVGLCVLYPAPNHKYSIPIKMLEYMSYGLAVIASENIEFCRQVISKEGCGLLVKPQDVESISSALKYLKANKIIAQQMGENGRKAVEREYNWQSQEAILLTFYDKLKY